MPHTAQHAGGYFIETAEWFKCKNEHDAYACHECVGYVEIDKFARKSYEAIYDTEGEWTRRESSKINTSGMLETTRISRLGFL